MKTTEAKPAFTTAVDASPATTEAKPEPERAPAAPATAASPASADAPPADPQKPKRPGIDEAAPGGRWTIEVWAQRKRTPAADLRTAKILRRWPEGRVVTEAEFDAAISDGRNLVFR